MGTSKSDIEYQWKLYSSLLSEETAHQLLKPSGHKGEYKKSDYVSALSKVMTYKFNHGGELNKSVSAKDIWNSLTCSERYRLSFYSPCLAKPIEDLNAKLQDDIFKSPDWIFTEKHRGLRCVLIINEGIINLYSRNYSSECRLIDYWSKVYQTSFFEGTYAIDVEMVINDSFDIKDDLALYNIEAESKPEQILGLMSLDKDNALSIQKQVRDQYGTDLIEFKMIAPLYYNGVNYLKRTLGEGIDAYNDAADFGKSIGLNISRIRRLNPSSEENKRIFLKSLLDSGSDGVVAQNRNGMYNTTDSRSKDSYIKIKHIGNGLGDTLDCFVSRVGEKIELSIYIDNNGRQFQNKVAEIKPTRAIKGKIELDSVIEMTGKSINVWKKLTSPKVVKLRPDKTKYECVYTNEFIDSQIRKR